MAIQEEDVARVRDTVDLVAVITEHLNLRRVGRRWQGLCPFHAEKTPSFSVNAEQGVYFCFGCGAKGDVFSFVQHVEHLGFVAAVEKLAGRAGVTLRYTSDVETETRRHRAGLYGALDSAVTWFQAQLAGPDGEAARGYLSIRGITGDMVARYRLGWAPTSGGIAAGVDVPVAVLDEAGLGYLDGGRFRDAFRARVMFPIFDAAGRPVGFGGRLLPGVDGPKYKNSKDGTLYNKSKVLYGLDLAKAPAVERDRVVVCEGYTDVIGLAACGIPEAVATCGTAITEQHLRVLTAYTRRVVFAFDADEAGQAAAAKVYQWEQALRLDVRVAGLPAGADPADVARTDPDRLRAAVDGAQPLLGWRLDRLLADVDSTPEGKARAASAATAMIGEHPDRLVRDQYVHAVADRLRLPVDRVADGLPAPPVVVAPVIEAPAGVEVEAIRLLIDQPAAMGPLVHPGLFTDPRALVVVDAFEPTDDAGVDVAALLARLDEPTGGWLLQVVAAGSDADPGDVARLLLRALVRRWLAEGRVPGPEVAQVKLWVEGLDDVDGVAWGELDRWVRLHA